MKVNSDRLNQANNEDKMSYSVCLKCEKKVSQYEKYCASCECEYKQDKMFWKTASYDYFKEPKKSEELKKDRMNNLQLHTTSNKVEGKR